MTEVETTETPIKNFKTAAKCLLNSYKTKSEDTQFKTTRTIIFHKAMLYKNKIAPFSEAVIYSIGKVCGTITYASDKSDLENGDLITKVELNLDLCYYTDKFYHELLTEFKVVGQQITNKILQQHLDNDFNKQLRRLMNEDVLRISEIRNVFKSFVNENGSNQITYLEETLETFEIFEPLLTSVTKYQTFLAYIAGIIKNIHNQLLDLKERCKDNELLKFIQGDAERVKTFCEKYSNATVDYETDLDTITKCQYEVLNRDETNEINKWIPDKIKAIDSETPDKFRELLAKIKDKRAINENNRNTIYQICFDEKK